MMMNAAAHTHHISSFQEFSAAAAKKRKQRDDDMASSAPSSSPRSTIDESGRLWSCQSGNSALLGTADAGVVYVDGVRSSALNQLLEENSAVPLFGFDLCQHATRDDDGVSLSIDAVKSAVGRLILEILFDPRHVDKDIVGALFQRLMYGHGESFKFNSSGGGSASEEGNSANDDSCLESLSLSSPAHGDPVGILAKALATRFAQAFPGENSYPCVASDMESVVKKIGHKQGSELVPIPKRLMDVLKRGGYLDLKRSDVVKWFQKCNCYRASANSKHHPPKEDDAISGSLSLQEQWSEQKREDAKTAGRVVLYLKAGIAGEGVGDCPFGQFVRIVLEEKGVDYDLKPCTLYNKPKWLIEEHGGMIPALVHGDRHYVESEVIAQYVDFVFCDDSSKSSSSASAAAKSSSGSSMSPYEPKRIYEAREASGAIFPAMARYLMHTPDGDEEDLKLRSDLETALQKLETFLSDRGGTGTASGPYLVGCGGTFTLADASLAPKLYHLQVGLKHFKEKKTEEASSSSSMDVVSLMDEFPRVNAYM
mmetsp:Transcript_43342/g.80597  ORF Transcript_43342/g.80597 Transcript_43342/m.80597 type:complete len:538 (-) Transcript_43342:176-1789(-)